MTTLAKLPPLQRDWSAAEVKRADWCRVCQRPRWEVPIELAHVIGRRCDLDQVSICEYEDDERGEVYSIRVAVVLPDRVIPLCGPATDSGSCHQLLDAHQLDVWDHLSKGERFQAIEDAGSLGLALRRCAPLTWDSRVEIVDGAQREVAVEVAS